MNERTKEVSFDGLRLHPSETVPEKSGVTRVYKTLLDTPVQIHDVRLRGERFVSLYCDGRLVKEYNVRVERLKSKYAARPEWYDGMGKFGRRAATASCVAALFCAFAAVGVLAAFSVFTSAAQTGILFGAIAVALWALFAGAACLRYAHLHALMVRYALISSVKPQKPKKRARQSAKKRRR